MFVSHHVTKHPQLTIHSALDLSAKDTILSAGSIDTPKILLLSGIGASEHLKTHDIPIILDQPSIGSNLRDHFIVRMSAAKK
jgi:choline dehydrogenase-like flavoprotein